MRIQIYICLETLCLVFASNIFLLHFGHLPTVAAANRAFNASTSLSTSRISEITPANAGIGPSMAAQNDCCALRRAGGTSIPNQFIGLEVFWLVLDFLDSMELSGSFGPELREDDDVLESVSSFPSSVSSFVSVVLEGERKIFSMANDGLLFFWFEFVMVGLSWAGIVEGELIDL